MPMDRFIVAPFANDSGLQTDVKPWLISDNAFALLQNAYVFRGRVRKRFGSRLLHGDTVQVGLESLQSRLRVLIDTTDVSGNTSGTVPGAIFAIGQMFSIGTALFTVYQIGTPGNMLRTDGIVAVATYNTTTGAYVINGAPALTDVYFYPAEPVMGLINYEVAEINDEPIFAFDTQFAYQFTSLGWERLATGDSEWTGSNSQFFWGANYRGALASSTLLFVTNFNENEPDFMRYWDGTTWTSFNPAISSGGTTVETCRIIIPFQNRLILLNTVEDGLSYKNRARFSMIGDPLAPTAFYETPDPDGYGGFVDNASTQEAIITAQIIKNRLIVFFESSTWEFVYTGNQVDPFRWQEINSELGAESTFSGVAFDKFLIGVGNVGIVQCNGSNVERIDNKIPQEVWEIHNDNGGVERVFGIRDYFTEMVYWTFPSAEVFTVFPTRVLVYNYITGTWAINDDSITAFGYYQQQSGETWSSITTTWEENEETWNSGSLDAKFRNVIAGNQEGFVFIVDEEEGRNAPSLQISNMTVSAPNVTIIAVNHNLVAGDFVYIEDAQGIVGLNGQIFKVDTGTETNPNQITIQPLLIPTGVYTGGGTLARVSNVQISSKEYNPYVKEGSNIAVQRIDFGVDRTDSGQVTVDYFASSSTVSLVQTGLATGALLGTSILETSPFALYPLEATQDRLWHPIYVQASGECIQFKIYMSDAQMMDPDIAFEDFQLNGFIIHANRTSPRLQ